MNIHVTIQIDGESAEVVSWLRTHLVEAPTTSAQRASRGSIWNPELVERLVNNVSPLARDVLYAIASSGSRGADERDLGMHWGFDPNQVRDSEVDVAASMLELMSQLDKTERGVGGVLSSIGAVGKREELPKPFQRDPHLDAYVMDGKVAALFRHSLRGRDSQSFGKYE